MADAHYTLGLCLERQARFAEADSRFQRAAELAPDRFKVPYRMTRQAFDEVVREAIAMLPAYFRRYLDNVQIVVDAVPSEDLLFETDPPLDPELFGLFQGIPLVERSLMDTVPAQPDRIHLFQRNIERYRDCHEGVVEEMRVTLLHEVGHAMGLDDEGLARLGYE